MMLDLFGAVCILSASCIVALQMTAQVTRRSALLHQFCQVLLQMEGEIRYNQLPLPELCNLIALQSQGSIRKIFQELTERLKSRPEIPVEDLFTDVLQAHNCPASAQQLWRNLAQTFCRYDPERQTSAVEYTRMQMQQLAQYAEKTKTEYCRRCRIFALCGGTTIVILLL